MHDCETWEAPSGGTLQRSREQRPGEDVDSVPAMSCEGDAHALRPGRLAGVLRVLWREQHPEGHEQSAMNFATRTPQAKNVLLFKKWMTYRPHDECGGGR